ncbi:GM16824 [Drosophila sechellia]|uniref:GM16824 n=1 Tax=Drosophila sechellia TaxID=7238 RepID=B4IDA5_DROSE|nr:GM16824 [Drosophila sechellia]
MRPGRTTTALPAATTPLLLLLPLILGRLHVAHAQCPWQRDVPDLQTSCICAYNLGRELSVQCDQVDFSQLLDAMNTHARLKPVDLLYVNNSTISELPDAVFRNLSLHNVQLSSCGIQRIATGAFKGQESVLRNLNLQDNLLTDVPVEALKVLGKLNLLDLSKNQLSHIPDDAFVGLTKLSTLKLNDNNVTLASNAFRGLEQSLKNINLKGTKQRKVPESIRGLKSLAFLDLSQNGIKELPGAGGIRVFDGLDALTALNLERNLIQSIGETAFAGVRKTLSSLSLLNNLLAEFPIGAVHSLKELRVLDIGFNLLTSLPEAAFRGNPGITLLALDGNPLSSVPEGAFAHLNATLRGLSLGGRFLHCDCKLRWVAEWIRNGDLQVTSRERNPQFCGTPPRFRDRGFYSIQPEELSCPDIADAALRGPVGLADNLKPTLPSSPDSVEYETGTGTGTGTVGTGTAASAPVTSSVSSSTSTTTPTTTTTTTTAEPTTRRSTTRPPTKSTTAISATTASPVSNPPVNGTGTVQATSITTSSSSSSSSSTSTGHGNGKQAPGWRQGVTNGNGNSGVGGAGGLHKPQRPPLVLGYPPQRGTRIDDANEVQVKHAFRQDSSVIIQWDSDTANILGFRVVYRLFGEKAFKQGPPLESSEREFKIKNVPAQECIIVCVISLEELHVTPETVPYQQCREVRTVASQASNMDKITIAASAAICGTIIVAVIVFIAASRRSRKLQSSQQKSPLPIGGLPVNCCGPTGSPGPLGSIATLSAFNNHKEWDQVSAYSGRSIPRPRIYPVEQPDDMRSHFSGMPGKVGKSSRSLADGQSQHSFSNNSHRGYLGSAFPSNLVNSRPELRQSRQSLAAASERMSRASYAGSIHGGNGGGGGLGGNGGGGGNGLPVSSLMAMSGMVGGGGPASIASSARRSRPRSRSREQLNTTHIHNHRPGSRYSQAGSTHTLNNYCDTSDNWTDHDMDIYMARNPTTRNGLGHEGRGRGRRQQQQQQQQQHQQLQHQQHQLQQLRNERHQQRHRNNQQWEQPYQPAQQQHQRLQYYMPQTERCTSPPDVVPRAANFHNSNTISTGRNDNSNSHGSSSSSSNTTSSSNIAQQQQAPLAAMTAALGDATSAATAAAASASGIVVENYFNEYERQEIIYHHPTSRRSSSSNSSSNSSSSSNSAAATRHVPRSNAFRLQLPAMATTTTNHILYNISNKHGATGHNGIIGNYKAHTFSDSCNCTCNCSLSEEEEISQETAAVTAAAGEDGEQAASSLASTSVSSIEQVQQGQEVSLSLNLTLADAAAGADADADAADASADRAEL